MECAENGNASIRDINVGLSRKCFVETVLYFTSEERGLVFRFMNDERKGEENNIRLSRELLFIELKS